MRSPILLLSIASLTLAGCATKKYVSSQVGEIGQKVDGLSAEVETTQDRVKANEARIDQVGRESEAGIRDASGAARQAMTRASEAESAARGKLVYVVTLSDDKVTFPLNSGELSDEARQMITETVTPLVSENRGVFLEIEGHTDSSGSKARNEALGQQRATAVRDFLHDQEGIALNRMAVISYGETEPVVDNDTREHRAMNRRVVIKVLE